MWYVVTPSVVRPTSHRRRRCSRHRPSSRRISGGGPAWESNPGCARVCVVVVVVCGGAVVVGGSSGRTSSKHRPSSARGAVQSFSRHPPRCYRGADVIPAQRATTRRRRAALRGARVVAR